MLPINNNDRQAFYEFFIGQLEGEDVQVKNSVIVSMGAILSAEPKATLLDLFQAFNESLNNSTNKNIQYLGRLAKKTLEEESLENITKNYNAFQTLAESFFFDENQNPSEYLFRLVGVCFGLFFYGVNSQHFKNFRKLDPEKIAALGRYCFQLIALNAETNVQTSLESSAQYFIIAYLTKNFSEHTSSKIKEYTLRKLDILKNKETPKKACLSYLEQITEYTYSDFIKQNYSVENNDVAFKILFSKIDNNFQSLVLQKNEFQAKEIKIDVMAFSGMAKENHYSMDVFIDYFLRIANERLGSSIKGINNYFHLLIPYMLVLSQLFFYEKIKDGLRPSEKNTEDFLKFLNGLSKTINYLRTIPIGLFLYKRYAKEQDAGYKYFLEIASDSIDFQLRAVEFFLICPVNKEDYKKTPNAIALLCAALQGCDEFINDFSGEDNSNNNYGGETDYTPLHIASKYGWLNVAKKLLENKAKTDISDIAERIPLEIAAENGNLKLFELLISSMDMSKLSHEKKLSIFNLAVKNKHLNILDNILGRNLISEKRFFNAIRILLPVNSVAEFLVFHGLENIIKLYVKYHHILPEDFQMKTPESRVLFDTVIHTDNKSLFNYMLKFIDKLTPEDYARLQLMCVYAENLELLNELLGRYSYIKSDRNMQPIISKSKRSFLGNFKNAIVHKVENAQEFVSEKIRDLTDDHEDVSFDEKDVISPYEMKHDFIYEKPISTLPSPLLVALAERKTRVLEFLLNLEPVPQRHNLHHQFFIDTEFRVQFLTDLIDIIPECHGLRRLDLTRFPELFLNEELWKKLFINISTLDKFESLTVNKDTINERHYNYFYQVNLARKAPLLNEESHDEINKRMQFEAKDYEIESFIGCYLEWVSKTLVSQENNLTDTLSEKDSFFLLFKSFPFTKLGVTSASRILKQLKSNASNVIYGKTEEETYRLYHELFIKIEKLMTNDDDKSLGKNLNEDIIASWGRQYFKTIEFLCGSVEVDKDNITFANYVALGNAFLRDLANKFSMKSYELVDHIIHSFAAALIDNVVTQLKEIYKNANNHLKLIEERSKILNDFTKNKIDQQIYPMHKNFLHIPFKNNDIFLTKEDDEKQWDAFRNHYPIVKFCQDHGRKYQSIFFTLNDILTIDEDDIEIFSKIIEDYLKIFNSHIEITFLKPEDKDLDLERNALSWLGQAVRTINEFLTSNIKFSKETEYSVIQRIGTDLLTLICSYAFIHHLKNLPLTVNINEYMEWVTKIQSLVHGCSQVFESLNYDTANEFHRAVAGGAIKSVKAMLKQNSHWLNIPIEQTGETPLFLAVHTQNLLMVNFLLQAGANAQLRDGCKRNILTVAAYLGNIELFNVILKALEHVTQNILHFHSPLRLAIRNNQLPMVKRLMEITGEKYKDLLEATIQEGHIKPLMVAAEEGYFSIVEYFITIGAKVDAENQNGETALFYATKNSHIEIVMYLVGKGANPLHLTRQSKAINYYALHQENQEMMDYVEGLVNFKRIVIDTAQRTFIFGNHSILEMFINGLTTVYRTIDSIQAGYRDGYYHQVDRGNLHQAHRLHRRSRTLRNVLPFSNREEPNAIEYYEREIDTINRAIEKESDDNVEFVIEKSSSKKYAIEHALYRSVKVGAIAVLKALLTVYRNEITHENFQECLKIIPEKNSEEVVLLLASEYLKEDNITGLFVFAVNSENYEILSEILAFHQNKIPKDILLSQIKNLAARDSHETLYLLYQHYKHEKNLKGLLSETLKNGHFNAAEALLLVDPIIKNHGATDEDITLLIRNLNVFNRLKSINFDGYGRWLETSDPENLLDLLIQNIKETKELRNLYLARNHLKDTHFEKLYLGLYGLKMSIALVHADSKINVPLLPIDAFITACDLSQVTPQALEEYLRRYQGTPFSKELACYYQYQFMGSAYANQIDKCNELIQDNRKRFDVRLLSAILTHLSYLHLITIADLVLSYGASIEYKNIQEKTAYEIALEGKKSIDLKNINVVNTLKVSIFTVMKNNKVSQECREFIVSKAREFEKAIDQAVDMVIEPFLNNNANEKNNGNPDELIHRLMKIALDTVFKSKDSTWFELNKKYPINDIFQNAFYQILQNALRVWYQNNEMLKLLNLFVNGISILAEPEKIEGTKTVIVNTIKSMQNLDNIDTLRDESNDLSDLLTPENREILLYYSAREFTRQKIYAHVKRAVFPNDDFIDEIKEHIGMLYFFRDYQSKEILRAIYNKVVDHYRLKTENNSDYIFEILLKLQMAFLKGIVRSTEKKRQGYVQELLTPEECNATANRFRTHRSNQNNSPTGYKASSRWPLKLVELNTQLKNNSRFIERDRKIKDPLIPYIISMLEEDIKLPLMESSLIKITFNAEIFSKMKAKNTSDKLKPDEWVRQAGEAIWEYLFDDRMNLVFGNNTVKDFYPQEAVQSFCSQHKFSILELYECIFTYYLRSMTYCSLSENFVFLDRVLNFVNVAFRTFLQSGFNDNVAVFILEKNKAGIEEFLAAAEKDSLSVTVAELLTIAVDMSYDNDTTRISLLLNNKKITTVRDEDDNNLLHYLAFKNRVDLFKKLHEEMLYEEGGGDLSSAMQQENASGYTPLHIAVANNSVSFISEALKTYGDISILNVEGFSPFALAMKHYEKDNDKFRSLLKVFLKNINSLNPEDVKNALIICATNNYRTAMIFYRKRHPRAFKIGTLECRELLIKATEKGHANIVNDIFEFYRNNNNKKSSKVAEELLWIALKNNQIGVFKILLYYSKNLDIYNPENKNHTLFMEAIKQEKIEFLYALLDKLPYEGKHNELLSKQDEKGNTVLHMAVLLEKDDVTVVKLLLDHGANANIVNNNNRTPVILAAQKGKRNIVETLRGNTKDFSAKDDCGKSAEDYLKGLRHLEPYTPGVVRRVLLPKDTKNISSKLEAFSSSRVDSDSVHRFFASSSSSSGASDNDLQSPPIGSPSFENNEKVTVEESDKIIGSIYLFKKIK